MEKRKTVLFFVLLSCAVLAGCSEPVDSETLMLSGAGKLGEGDYEGAVADFTEVIRRNPDDLQGYNCRGLARDLAGDHEGAIADFDRVIELDPDFAPGYFNRGNARHNKGDYDKAIADYTEAIRLHEKAGSKFAAGVAYAARAESRRIKKDYDGALADCSRAIELDPEHGLGHVGRGNVKCDKGDYEGAIADYEEATQVNAKSAIAFYKWSRVLALKGQKGAMLEKLGKAIELYPRYRREAKEDKNFEKYWEDPEFKKLTER